MSLLDRSRAVRRRVPESSRRIPGWLVVVAVPALVVVIGAGVWIAGAVPDDERTAMLLTGAWFLLVGVLVVLAALRWRALAVPLLATLVISVVGIGGYLFVASNVDRTVNEDVLVAPPISTPEAGEPADAAPAEVPVTLTDGSFESRAHETSGTATVIERVDGSRVLTLTDFATDPGPDLRVYLVSGDGSSTSGSVDLGALKGNKGNQQYDVPADAPVGAVVVWCRAFTVAFGSARLA